MPIAEVRFEGRDALDEDLLRSAIATTASTCRSALARPLCWLGIDRFRDVRTLDESETRRDVERLETLYELWGYPDARVELRIDRRGDAANVIFLIEEGEPIRVAELSIAAPDTLDLPGALPLRVGEPYALPLLDASIDRIQHALAGQGYPYSDVLVGGSVDEQRRLARVRLTVEPGLAAHFGPIRIDAAEPISSEVVRERLAFRSGEPYSIDALQQTERRLYALPAIGEALVLPSGLRDTATVIPVDVAVRPRRLHGIDVEGTLSSTDCLELATFWTHRYAFGGPRVLSLGGSVANLGADALSGFPCTAAGSGRFARLDYAAEVRLWQPLPGSPETRVRAHAFAERYSAPDVYVERAYGGEVGISHALRPDLSASAHWSPRRFRLDAAAVYFCANYGVCRQEGIQSVSGPSWLAPIGLAAVYRSDARLEGIQRPKLPAWAREPLPRTRLTLNGALELSGGWSGSDFAYARFIAEAAPARRLGSEWELAARLRLGALTGDDALPPQVRLYAGGPESVRGAGQHQLGPASLVADEDDLAALGCAPEPDGCPAQLSIGPERVVFRPAGGSALAAASIELRRNIAERVQLAAFVDYGTVWSDVPWRDDVAAPPGEALIAPGIGVRLMANIGAIRLDLALDTRGRRTLPLFGSIEGDIVRLGRVAYAPYDHDDPGAFEELWRRLQLHVALGQPF